MDNVNDTRHCVQKQHDFKTESAGEYVFVLAPGNQMSDKRGRILEHRFIMSQVLGRGLLPSEIVHHKNGNKKDNRAENLSILDARKHHEIHQPKNILHIECPQCGKNFGRVARNARGKKTFCSRSCAAKFYYSKEKFKPKTP